MASTRTRRATAPTETVVSNGPIVTLAQVVDATREGIIVYTSPEFHLPFIGSGELEINPEMKDENGNIATRATEKAMNPMTESATQTAPVAAVAAKAKPVFEIKTGTIPERVRSSSGNLRAGRTPVYPFDQLEVNQYFFVPNDPTAKAPADKSLASTVAGANARYSEEIPGSTARIVRVMLFLQPSNCVSSRFSIPKKRTLKVKLSRVQRFSALHWKIKPLSRVQLLHLYKSENLLS